MSLPDYSGPSPVDGYYDVFLSFCGKDTLRYFTTYLCHSLRRGGIRTFMGEIGEPFNDFIQIIPQSRIAIVVYSENYASCSWCLEELEMIMEHRRTHGMKMIPIFHEVNPAELRPPLSGQTAHHLHKLRQIKGAEFNVHKWKAALTEFGQVPGLSYKDENQRAEYAFIDDVVSMIKKQQLPSMEQAPASYEYDVFSSFRGDDTREAFTSTLCYVLCVGHKVKTFMDVSLRKGHKLEELLKIIEKSRMSIVVFSENFTESEWCLKELEKIFEESNRRGHEVVPVFYKVNPSELRNQNSGKTKKHMDKHHNTHGKESKMVKTWSKAIDDLGHMSGHTYLSGTGQLEVELATEIAQDICTRLHDQEADQQGSTMIASSSKLRDIISMVKIRAKPGFQ